jgi:hypothetical protein
VGVWWGLCIHSQISIDRACAPFSIRVCVEHRPVHMSSAGQKKEDRTLCKGPKEDIWSGWSRSTSRRHDLVSSLVRPASQAITTTKVMLHQLQATRFSLLPAVPETSSGTPRRARSNALRESHARLGMRAEAQQPTVCMARLRRCTMKVFCLLALALSVGAQGGGGDAPADGSCLPPTQAEQCMEVVDACMHDHNCSVCLAATGNATGVRTLSDFAAASVHVRSSRVPFLIATPPHVHRASPHLTPHRTAPHRTAHALHRSTPRRAADFTHNVASHLHHLLLHHHQ